MKFYYLVVDASNKLKKGVIDAPNLKTATRLLVEQGWFIKRIFHQRRFSFGSGQLSFGRVSLLDKVLLAKHLGAMIRSGISINEALDVIIQQSASPKFKKIVKSVAEKVQTGQSLSNSFARFPRVFDSFFVSIIRVGEDSGALEDNLEYLSGELEDQLDLRRKIKAASFYPAIVLTATIGLGLILAYFVLPKIRDLFSTLQFDLPLSTRILLKVAEIFDHYGLYIIFGLVGAIVAWRILIQLKPIKPRWHALLLKMPVLGPIFIDYNLTVIARTMGILLKSGLTIDQALRVAADTTQNLVYRRHLLAGLEQIQRGTQFSVVLSGIKQSKRRPIFPLLSIKMIGVGERTGKLDESFNYLAGYFEKEIDNAAESLTSVLEPVLLLFVGLIVGFVAVSVISPIYQITGQFRG